MINYLDGYDRKEVTLNALFNVSKGRPVTISSDFTVRNADDGEVFAGICTNTGNGSASVQLKGFVKLSFTGEAPSYGYCKLVSDGMGAVKASADGREALVVSVDKTAMVCGIIL